MQGEIIDLREISVGLRGLKDLTVQIVNVERGQYPNTRQKNKINNHRCHSMVMRRTGKAVDARIYGYDYSPETIFYAARSKVVG